MSFLSAQGSNAVFNNTVVNDLTVTGKLTMVNGLENVEVQTITSLDGTNQIDLSIPNEIIYKSALHNFDGNINMEGYFIDHVRSIHSPDETSTIDLSVANAISFESATSNFTGNINMNGHNVNNVGTISGNNGVLLIDTNNQLLVKGGGTASKCKTQGSYVDWNNVTGQMSLICNRGSGTGGFSLYNVHSDSTGNVDSTTTNEITNIDGAGAITTFSTTDSTSVGTGALIVKGGVGVAKNYRYI